MRRFEHALRLDETPIGEIRINVKSRDDILALLLGLQHLYVSCREELEALLGCHVTGDRDPENGRPGMTLWRVLVMEVLKQGLHCDYDRLGELVNHHQGGYGRCCSMGFWMTGRTRFAHCRTTCRW